MILVRLCQSLIEPDPGAAETMQVTEGDGMAGFNHQRTAGQVADQGNTDGWGRGRDNVGGVDVAAGELVVPTEKDKSKRRRKLEHPSTEK